VNGGVGNESMQLLCADQETAEAVTIANQSEIYLDTISLKSLEGSAETLNVFTTKN